MIFWMLTNCFIWKKVFNKEGFRYLKYPMNRPIFLLPLNIFILAVLVSCASSDTPEASKQGLRIVSVQLCIDTAVYASEQNFYRYAESIITRAKELYNPDLIVFPEYTSALFLLFSFPDETQSARNLEDFKKMLQDKRNDRLLTLRRLFMENDCGGVTDRMWGGLAATHDVYILGGTYFAPEADTGRLYNRAVVYGPDGKRFYEQDKVYIAPFEKQFFRLKAAGMESARPFVINGRSIVLTICRDTYYDAWEEYFSGADAWINIKANNEPFRSDRESYFTWSLVNRINGSSVKNGISACLTGELFGERLEGKSVVITDNSVHFSNEHYGEALLFLELK